nr:YciI family protein [uncultured Holophaga sp.]
MEHGIPPQADGVDTTHAGMQKLFYVCTTVPQRPPEELEQHLDAHKSYLKQLEQQGLIFAAGPLLNEEARFDGLGMIVYAAQSYAQAKSLADNDPFHAKGLRTYTLKPWQVNEGSLGLKLVFSEGSFRLV